MVSSDDGEWLGKEEIYSMNQGYDPYNHVGRDMQRSDPRADQWTPDEIARFMRMESPPYEFISTRKSPMGEAL